MRVGRLQKKQNVKNEIRKFHSKLWASAFQKNYDKNQFLTDSTLTLKDSV